MMNIKVLVCSVACVFMLSACGQKGDLYLPNTNQTIDKTTNASQAGHGKDDFLVPEIKKRIEDMQNNPNDF